MSARRLPRHPSLEHLKKQAKQLQRQAVAGDAEATALVRELHPQKPDPAQLKHTDAQLVLARSYGFTSWMQLRDRVETVDRNGRSPHHEPEGEMDIADRFVRLACLTYGAASPDRWREAAALLTAHPEITAESIFTAAASGDITAARGWLARGPEDARSSGPSRRRRPPTFSARLSVSGRSATNAWPVGVSRTGKCGSTGTPNAG